MPPQELEKNIPANENVPQEPTPKDMETAFYETFKNIKPEQLTAANNAIQRILEETTKQEAPAPERPLVGETQHPYDVGRIGINALSKEFNIPLTGETRSPDEVRSIGLDAVRKEFEPEPVPVTESNREHLIGRIGLAAVAKELEPPVQEKELELPAPHDPSVIPPQTKEGIAPYTAAEVTAMAGTETHLEALKRKTVEYGSNMAQSTAEFLPDSFIGRIGTRAQILGIELLSAPKKAALEGMYRWRSERAAKAEAKVAEKAAEVTKMESLLVKKDASIEKIKSGGPELYTADVAAIQERERHDILKLIEGAKLAQNKAKLTLEYRNNKKKFWEDRENAHAEQVTGEIEKLMIPARATFEGLTIKKESIAEKLASLKRAQDMGHSGLADLEARLKANPTAIEKVEIHTTLDAVKELLGRIDTDYAALSNKNAGVSAKMNRVNLKIGIGEVAKAKQASRTAGRTTPEYSFSNAEPKRMHIVPTPDTTPKPAEVATPEVPVELIPDTTTATTPEAPAMTGYDTTVIDDTPAAPEAKLEPTQEKKVEGIEIVHIDAASYLKKWNDLYQQEMPLVAGDIVKLRPRGVDWNDLTPKEFMTTIKLALQKKINGNTVYTKAGEKVVYTEQGMEERLNKAFDAYKQDLKKTAVN